jgi:hypothetical protein
MEPQLEHGEDETERRMQFGLRRALQMPAKAKEPSRPARERAQTK